MRDDVTCLACVANAEAPDVIPVGPFPALRVLKSSHGHAFVQYAGVALGYGWWKCDLTWLRGVDRWVPTAESYEL